MTATDANKKSKRFGESLDSPDSENPQEPKYPKPLILLMDVDPEVTRSLRGEGYDVQTGRFGRRFQVSDASYGYNVPIDYNVPQHYQEREVVVVDLALSNPMLEIPAPDMLSLDNDAPKLLTDYQVQSNQGFIDARPFGMCFLRNDLDRILHYGGIFVIFASSKVLHIMRDPMPRGMVPVHQSEEFDTWGLLSILNILSVQPDQGTEIRISDQFACAPLGCTLSRYLPQASFDCTLSVPSSVRDDQQWLWLPLAYSKYGDQVAGVLSPNFKDIADERKVGAVYIFPQMSPEGKADILLDLFQNTLPSIHPWLFPHAEELTWIYGDPYELPRVRELQERISKIEVDAEKRISGLRCEIKRERKQMQFLQGLLTQTGNQLVRSVKWTLELLGFEKVIDADRLVEKSNGDKPKREDLQIQDASPVLLIEVKGINGIPTDEDALTVQKYFAPRMWEWNRTDVRGFTLINHQRSIPPIERNNSTLFREDIIMNAQQHGFGLWTTWDLYRLARSYMQNKWDSSVVKPLFYRSGCVEPVPTHYQFIGVVNKVFPEPKAIVLDLQDHALAIGDRIALELSVVFAEQEVTSLRIDNCPVSKASPDVEVGVRLSSMADIHKGIRVFLVSQESN